MHSPETPVATDWLAERQAADQRGREEAFALPLDQIDVTKPRLYQDDTIGHYFARLRRDAPVHWHENAFYGGFWSVTQIGRAHV